MPGKNLNEDDRKKGLLKSKEIRKKRAGIKNLLKKGELELNQVFRDNKMSGYIVNMKVIDLISALPGIGKVKAKRILANELNISLNKKIRGLGKNQKEKFSNYFNIDKL